MTKQDLTATELECVTEIRRLVADIVGVRWIDVDKRQPERMYLRIAGSRVIGVYDQPTVLSFAVQYPRRENRIRIYSPNGLRNHREKIREAFRRRM